MSPDIDKSPVRSNAKSMGWFPDVGLHSRGGVTVQESSYAMLWFAMFLFSAAIACCFIPWEERSFLGRGPKVIYFIAGGLAWGGICTVGMYVIRNAIGERITIDSEAATVTIKSRDGDSEFPLSNLIGIQICGDACTGYQSNLVYSTPSGEIVRHCLHCHISKWHCERLAVQYRSRCGIVVFDHTEAKCG